MSTLKIPTAKVFEPLLAPARYKGAFGGRGSGKSHFFGELLVETCQAERGTLAVCIREAQRTLAQSSKRLIGYDNDINIHRRQEGKPPVYKLVRARTVAYAAIIAVVGGAMVYKLAT
ncbi:MAG: hypothetical protein E6501_28740, partial [Bradyrhizobium sp.]|nr:hypothetical protein [Bradyrhizobium sp.]